MLLASEVNRQGWFPCLPCSQQREKHLQNRFCFILRWVDGKGGMTHLLGLHLCLYSLWRKLSDELSQGPTLWIAWHKSHLECLWQTRSLLEELGPCNNCTQEIEKIWCAAIFEDRDPDSYVQHPYLILSQEEMLEMSFFRKIISQPRLWVSWKKSGSPLGTRQSVAHFS